MRPRNRAAAATCSRDRCELPVILKSLAIAIFFVAGEAKNLAISAAEWFVTVVTAILRCELCAAKCQRGTSNLKLKEVVLNMSLLWSLFRYRFGIVSVHVCFSLKH